jgi:hypothetical protein
MKTLLTIVLFTSLGLCISCDLGLGIHEPTELEKLPPLTTTGENTFGYLLNGEAIVVKNSLKITAIYQHGQLQLGGGLSNERFDIDLAMFLSDPLEINLSYDVAEKSTFTDFDDFLDCKYELTDAYAGYIEFSKIDRSNFIISGTFEFSTATAQCDTVHITDGRFDVQYTP